VPGIGAASSLLLLQGAKREAIIRLLVWMAVGLLVYILYGRTHSEINNPRLTMDEPMRVLHENFSVDTVNYQGYTDEDLRQQYARQLSRRMEYDRPVTQRQSAYIEDRATRDFSEEAARAGEGFGPGDERPSQGDDCTSSQGGIDSGHGVGGVSLEIRTKPHRDSSSTTSIHSDPKTPSSSCSARSFHQLQPPARAAHYPESAYIPPRTPPR